MASPHTPLPAPLLQGSSVFLRALTEEDATPRYAAWLNDPEVNKYLETRSVTVDELRKFIREKNANPQVLLLGIFWGENHLHIGNIKLEPIDERKGCATMGILIGDRNYWGKGVATEAITLLADYAFSHWKIRSLDLGVITENFPAIRAYEKCGFKVERVNKGAIDHGGILFDQLRMRKRKSHAQTQQHAR
ncbi:MAG: GNAT family N-acetyltransferase [Candidatus Peribacteraceae bacterium]|nr:GNAT family N-acetyltransferase [Candidatus Peribacteraceae bacterium]